MEGGEDGASTSGDGQRSEIALARWWWRSVGVNGEGDGIGTSSEDTNAIRDC